MSKEPNSGKEKNAKENCINHSNLKGKDPEKNNNIYENISEIKEKKKENNNYIIGNIEIQEPHSIKRIINSFENLKREAPNWYWNLIKEIENEEQIKQSQIFINNKKINFSYYYDFPNIGNYTIKYDFQNLLTSTSFMFFDCDLNSLDFSNFNSQNIKDMKFMFYKCNSLSSLDLSNFNAQNVESLEYLFFDCSSLTSLDLSNFNTQNAINMGNIFVNCRSLRSLDLSHFKTQNVKKMKQMF